MSEVEQELLEATGFKYGKRAQRQDNLAGLVRAIEKLKNDDFEELSDEAVEWFNNAVDSMNDKEDINDFDAGEPAADEPDSNGADAAEAEADEDDDSDTDDAEATGEDEGDDAEAEAENEAAEAAASKKKAVKAKPKAKAKPKKSAEDYEKFSPKRYAIVDGQKDRYGIIKGTKTHEAALMYEHGATQKEIVDKLGGRFYNVLRRLAKQGHRVENDAGRWTLIHKDDIKKGK